MKLRAKPMTVDHLVRFKSYARLMDLEEVEIGYMPFKETPISDYKDAEALVDEDTQDVFAIGGVTEENLIWMLCTYRVEEDPIPFLRFAKQYLNVWLDKYGTVENYAWTKNELHIKWLKFMGATFMDVVSVEGEPFIHFKFEKRSDDNV